jgi:hypothetical protein
MTLQPCQIGSEWTNTLTVKRVPEERSPYIVEKCDYVDGCKCDIADVMPDKAKGRPFDTVYINDTHTLLKLGQRRNSLRYYMSREKKCFNCV